MHDLVLRERCINEDHRADATRQIAGNGDLGEIQKWYVGPSETTRRRCWKAGAQIGRHGEERRCDVLELEVIALADSDQKFFSRDEYRVAVVAYGLRRAANSPYLQEARHQSASSGEARRAPCVRSA